MSNQNSLQIEIFVNIREGFFSPKLDILVRVKWLFFNHIYTLTVFQNILNVISVIFHIVNGKADSLNILLFNHTCGF